MKTLRSGFASLEVALIVPAALFMTALVVRSLQPQQFEPAHTAQRIVDWYAARTHLGLWVFLIAFPLAVLVTGCVSLARSWRGDAALRTAARELAVTVRSYFPIAVVALATAGSAVILAIGALDMITG